MRLQVFEPISFKVNEIKPLNPLFLAPPGLIEQKLP